MVLSSSPPSPHYLSSFNLTSHLFGLHQVELIQCIASLAEILLLKYKWLKHNETGEIRCLWNDILHRGWRWSVIKSTVTFSKWKEQIVHIYVLFSIFFKYLVLFPDLYILFLLPWGTRNISKASSKLDKKQTALRHETSQRCLPVKIGGKWENENLEMKCRHFPRFLLKKTAAISFNFFKPLDLRCMNSA